MKHEYVKPEAEVVEFVSEAVTDDPIAGGDVGSGELPV